jgi:hypothetical protein
MGAMLVTRYSGFPKQIEKHTSNQKHEVYDTYLFRQLQNLFCVMLLRKGVTCFPTSRACAIKSALRYSLM